MVEHNGRVSFEGGPLDGKSYELPPGTVEILIAGLMPGNDRYELVLRNDGIVARWVGLVPSRRPDDVSS